MVVGKYVDNAAATPDFQNNGCANPGARYG
jgi:hypothetical protein